MMANPARDINVGILGAGGIAALSHLPEIAEIDGMRVTHVCGRTESRLKLLCDRFTVPRSCETRMIVLP